MKDIWGAMSDPTRREILSLLQKQDMTAGEIADRFAISNATISHHLKILREAELVTSEKEKQTITYRINMTVFQEFLAGIAAAFGTGGKSDEK
ncbi:MAG: winged helix-turn-helix transcriptional regulator [Oscillospiraceae bacterium]|nr:winged helix-turn-helix transcriptional regulator [Oscillospiraceae bacterium]